ncbi:MAG: PD-(D/E)XK nuclease family protein [Planctomycetaceae bacterium]|nr:PD-(D/E)XK nuclease family protein [Planctomycetaceae bacterium]
MDRGACDILGRVGGSSCRVVLLRGPAGSGKTRACLEFYRSFEPTSTRRCLYLVPNAPAGSSVRRQLLSAGGGVLVAPMVRTFAELAQGVLAASPSPGRLMSGPARMILLRRIVDELSASRKLEALESVVDTPGVVAALDRAIAELKRAAIEPETLAQAVAGGSAKCRDLLNVYRLYQDHLLRHGLYDVEGQMWQVRDVLTSADGGFGDRGSAGLRPCAPRHPETSLPGLETVAAVAVDGFTDFTPTQLAILSLLARRSERILITLPWAQDGRERMWHWTARTLNKIRETFGGDLEEIALDAPAGGGGLAELAGKLFTADAPPMASPGALRVVAAPGTEAEVWAVAQAVKKLLVGADSQAGKPVPPGSIAVLARSLEAYRPTIARVFAACDIPIAHPSGPLTDEPIVRFLLAAAAIAPRQEFADVLAVLRSSYFRPQALGDFTPATAAVAEMIIRQGNVLEGRAAYARAVKSYAARAARAEADNEDGEEPAVRLGPLDCSRDEIVNAGEMLERLFDLTDAAATSGIAKLVDELQLRAAACGHADTLLVARDLRALAALEGALGELEGAAAGIVAVGLAPSRHGTLPLPHLRSALGAAAAKPARTESLVDVLDVLDARAVRYEHVFILGLGEGQFPPASAESPLAGEADRTLWAARGIELDSRSDLTAREMLLFYLAISRAEQSLTLTYQHTDAGGRAGSRGAFLETLLECIDSPSESKIPPGAFVPPQAEIACRQDAVNAGIGGLFDSSSPPAGGALAWAAANERAAVSLAARGIWARHRRWLSAPCDAYDGRIGDPSLLAALGKHFGEDHAFSASQLNTFGLCPWRFFGKYVLQLEPLEEPQRRIEPVERGIFCHEVLCRVMMRLRDGGAVRLAAVGADALAAALTDAVAQASDVLGAKYAAYPRLWELQRQRMHQDIGDYLAARSSQDALAAESVAFELGFGLDARAAEGPADPAGTNEPVSIATPTGTVRVKGKIDRVDRVSFEGHEGLMVVDYKTGALPRPDAIKAAQNVQLPVYIKAAEALLGAKCIGGLFDHVSGGKVRRLFFAEIACSRGKYKINEAFAEQLDEALAAIGRTVESIRAGRFDLMPAGGCDYCDYRQICQYVEARQEVKAAAGEHGRDAHATQQEHGRDAHATLQEGATHNSVVRVPDRSADDSQEHGRDAHATQQEHGRDAHATQQEHGRDAHATQQEHGRDAHATKQEHGRDAHATQQEHGRDAHATGEGPP